MWCCDFVGRNNCTIYVHIGKVNSEYLECGLWEFKADNLGNLEMHLFTTVKREKILSNIKTHVEK